jgi:carboxypeptidase D
VNGNALPNITWDIGESYAGLLPITDDKNDERKLFFWFFASYNPEPKDEIVVWCTLTICLNISLTAADSLQ